MSARTYLILAVVIEEPQRGDTPAQVLGGCGGVVKNRGAVSKYDTAPCLQVSWKRDNATSYGVALESETT